MRTTLTVDDDIFAGLEAEMRESGNLSFKETVNTVLRRGLMVKREFQQAPPFVLKGARDLGAKPGISFDNISELLEQLEGPGAR